MILRTIALAAMVLLPSLCASAAEVAYYDLPAGAFPHDVAPLRMAPSGTPTSIRGALANLTRKPTRSSRFRSAAGPPRTGS
jgi:hypothetical protein